jgi:hypothetical protein
MENSKNGGGRVVATGGKVRTKLLSRRTDSGGLDGEGWMQRGESERERLKMQRRECRGSAKKGK